MRANCILHLLFLLLISWFVSGFSVNSKLNENEAKLNSKILQKNRNGSRSDYVDEKEAIRSNVSILHWNDLVDVWSPYLMIKLWKNVARELLNISANCKKDTTDYITALSTGEQWGLKMVDASGRYTWGLFSGNGFWLGSADQCGEMETQFVEWQKNREVQRKRNVPPFLVSMNSVTLSFDVHRDGLNETRKITFGLCLPDSCNPRDVENLFYFVQDQHKHDTSTKIVVQNVRNLSKGYSLWEDHVFYMLLIASVVVIVLLILGTFYDIHLRYQVLRRSKEDQSNRNIMTEMEILNSKENTDKKITIAKLWLVTEHNGTLDVCNSNSTPKPLPEALLSFSLLVNISKIFSFEVGADTLAPIHGLRFISMIWIILVHTCLILNEVSDSKTFRTAAENDFLYQTISNGTYAVDTFFFMSGCLVSFLYFRTITNDKLRKNKTIKGSCGYFLQFLGMTWYRYFRLTTPYLFVIGLVQVLMPWQYDHKMPDLFPLDQLNCRQYWWRNILYINTYFTNSERCITWSWYLANDTQFYIIGIIILIVAVRFISTAAFVTIILLIVSWITTGIIAMNIQHIPSVEDPFAHYESLYDKPWSRIGPYLIGMIVGWYLYSCNCKLNINRTVASLSWILSFITMLSIVYGLYGSAYNLFISASYTALSHSGWAVSVAWILIACVTGHGGMINEILSWKYLYPFSRLTYCVYLLHPIIIRAIIIHNGTSLHLTQPLLMIMFFGYTVASFAVALFLSLLFEAPMVSLLRIFHPLRQWKKIDD